MWRRIALSPIDKRQIRRCQCISVFLRRSSRRVTRRTTNCHALRIGVQTSSSRWPRSTINDRFGTQWATAGVGRGCVKARKLPKRTNLLLCIPKMLSGANAFGISDIREDEHAGASAGRFGRNNALCPEVTRNNNSPGTRRRAGRLLDQRNSLKALHGTGNRGGFHVFRSFRFTVLRRAGVPENLIKLWMGLRKT